VSCNFLDNKNTLIFQSKIIGSFDSERGKKNLSDVKLPWKLLSVYQLQNKPGTTVFI
jgi:hypothetical protein